MATIGKSIKTALRVFDTEDGYRFFELPDGKVVDNLDPDAVDMAFDNIEQLKDEMGDGVIQVGDELSEFRYKKNNADPFELQRQLAKLMRKGIPSAAGAGVLGTAALAPQEAEAGVVTALNALPKRTPEMIKDLLKRGTLPVDGADYRLRDEVQRVSVRLDDPDVTIREQLDGHAFIRNLHSKYASGAASAAGAGVLGASALAPQEAEAKIISSLQALREGEIKAPKNARTAQLATAIRAGERAVKGSPAEFVYPSGLAPWLERIAYDEEPTKMETVMAIADFL